MECFVHLTLHQPLLYSVCPLSCCLLSLGSNTVIYLLLVISILGFVPYSLTQSRAQIYGLLPRPLTCHPCIKVCESRAAHRSLQLQVVGQWHPRCRSPLPQKFGGSQCSLLLGVDSRHICFIRLVESWIAAGLSESLVLCSLSVFCVVY